jgi:hypothetical protein
LLPRAQQQKDVRRALLRQHIAAAAADLTQSARCRLRAMCMLLRLAVQQQADTTTAGLHDAA